MPTTPPKPAHSPLAVLRALASLPRARRRAAPPDPDRSPPCFRPKPVELTREQVRAMAAFLRTHK